MKQISLPERGGDTIGRLFGRGVGATTPFRFVAPAITGIPELVEHARTGFLYEPGSMRDFLSALSWILDRRFSLAHVGRAAAASISVNYNRQTNLRRFADHFLERIASTDHAHENSLLQQVQLSV